MRYESRKILKNGYILLFLALLVVCNGALFYRQCMDDSPGYTLAQMQEKYGSWETLEQEAQALRDEIDAAAMTGDIEFIVAHSDEDRLNQAVLERIAQAQGYGQYRADLIRQAELMRSLGLTGGSGSFADQSLARGIEEYKNLDGTSPEVCFTGGIERMTTWPVADVFVLLFGVAGSLVLLTMEKKAGYFGLLKTTCNGRGRLYIRKFATMVLLLSLGFVLLQGSQLLIVSALFGLEHLSAPIQSIFGYNGSPLGISIGEYLAGLLGMKYLWALACVGIIFAICSFAKSQITAMGAAAAALAASLLLGQTDSLWLRAMSLSNVTQFDLCFREGVYLNLLGKPLGRISFTLVFLALLLVVSFVLGLTAFRVTPKGTAKRKQPRLPMPRIGCHTSLTRHEGYKIYVLQGGALILAVFLAVQALTYQSFQADNSEFERYYQHYSSILEGAPTEEKAQYLESEALRFTQIEGQLRQLQEQYPDPNDFAIAAGELPGQLRPREAFEKAKAQYEALSEGQSYLYETPYMRLFGEEGQREDLTDLAKGIFALILVLAGVFAVEQETGVAVLQAAAGKEKALTLRKLLHICVFAMLVWAIAFVPMPVWIHREYGALAFGAQANSTQVLAALKDGWTVGGALAVSLTGKLIALELAALAVFFVSKRVRSTTVTLLLCLPAALAPLLLLLLSGR